MLNKLRVFLRRYNMVKPGDRVICAVSGGADSVAMLFAMYLLSDQLKVKVEAAHFNHHLRSGESDRDEAFVQKLCDHLSIRLYVGDGHITAGKKGLEASARDARYAFLRSLGGKIATAHTADDNAETVLMHLTRGTGLKGLGGISPVAGNVIRPMLSVTRCDVLTFLEEYNLSFVQDSSNDTDHFLRNRLRHHVMPFFSKENPRFSENLSAMALRLREDEKLLESLIPGELPAVSELRTMPDALRTRALAVFLNQCGLQEPESEHISAVDSLVFSKKPSASVSLPGDVMIRRNYDSIEKSEHTEKLKEMELECPGCVDLEDLGVRIITSTADHLCSGIDEFTVRPKGKMFLRCRISGDTIRLPGGTKELKKLFIDRKIPAYRRMQIPVIADAEGVLGVFGVGPNLDRLSYELPAVEVRFEQI